jgi:hypothetical protein
MEKCQRCKSKDAVFSCIMCESFKLLCVQCDAYVHGLPSKKKHKRSALIQPPTSSTTAETKQTLYATTTIPMNYENNNTEYANYNTQNNQEEREDINWDYRFNLQTAPNTTQDKKSSSITYNPTNPNYLQSNGFGQGPISIEENSEPQVNQFPSYSQAFRINTSNNYSKEFLNEIKVIILIIFSQFMKKKNQNYYSKIIPYKII